MSKVIQINDTKAILTPDILEKIEQLQECNNGYIYDAIGYCDIVSRMIRKERDSLRMTAEQVLELVCKLDEVCSILEAFKLPKDVNNV